MSLHAEIFAFLFLFVCGCGFKLNQKKKKKKTQNRKREERKADEALQTRNGGCAVRGPAVRLPFLPWGRRLESLLKTGGWVSAAQFPGQAAGEPCARQRPWGVEGEEQAGGWPFIASAARTPGRLV